jgi:cardiolipin synthase
VLTYANQLTILRMIFAPCFVLMLIYHHPKSATLILILAGLTDGLDGLLARKFDQKTSLGSFLDPMADKILLTAAFVTLTIPSVPAVFHIPIWLTVLAISRDLLIAFSALIIHLRTGHSQFPPTLLGKCTTASQLVLVCSIMVANFLPALMGVIFQPLVFVTLFFTVSSGLHYFYRSAKLIEAYQRTGPENGTRRYQDR